MNKTSACIKLLQLLNCKEVMNKQELASVLEINPRNISEYIKELQVAGYDIVSVKGRFGGYHLNKTNLFPVLTLDEDEVKLIRDTNKFLEGTSEYLNYNQFYALMGKILSTSEFPNMSHHILTIIERYPLTMPKEEIIDRYNAFSVAIDQCKKCKINYLSSHNTVKDHILHPYKVFVYNGSWFVLAWNETVHDFGYFKLNRIQSVEVLPNYFVRLKTYDESMYLDEFGMKQNGKYYRIKLELKDLYTVICERIYGRDQVITKVDDHTTILECDMQNKRMILTFVLSFGSKAKVIEPLWLKEEVLKEAQAMLNNMTDEENEQEE